MAKLKFQAASQTRRQRPQKKWWIIAIIGAILVVTFAVLELTNTTHIFHKGVPKTKQITQVGNPSTETPEPTPEPSPPKDKAPDSTQAGGNQGGATDTSGQTSSNNDPSKWIVAKSGNITVKQPLANATLKTGNALIGSAKVSQVQYRLIDNKVGVLAQGALSVVNGNFSGNLKFSPSASTGRLDVFSIDVDGTEINEIQIAVNF